MYYASSSRELADGVTRLLARLGIIARIRDTLEGSMDQPDWPRRYALAKMNIEDLKKTLAYGGKITSNPVAAFRAKLQAMLDERSAAFFALASLMT